MLATGILHKSSGKSEICVKLPAQAVDILAEMRRRLEICSSCVVILMKQISVKCGESLVSIPF
jgi:hypothetical protein